jgi:hypothetical protein
MKYDAFLPAKVTHLKEKDIRDKLGLKCGHPQPAISLHHYNTLQNG